MVSTDDRSADIARMVRANCEAQRDAMVAADAGALGAQPTAPGPLQLRIRFTRACGAWLASDTVASTWR
jgi:hypothetical protein